MMDNIDQDILELATEWLLRIENGLSQEEEDEYNLWMLESELHVYAYNQVANSWQLAENIDVDTGNKVVVEKVPNGAWWRKGFELVLQPRLLAGVVSILLIVFITVFYFSNVLNVEHRQTYISQVGEIVKHTLDDNSQLVLDTNSQITTNFSRHQRQVSLLSGQLFVNVAHEKNRRFIVKANDIDFIALGTAFSVKADAIGTRLEVTQGRVEVIAQGVKNKVISAGYGLLMNDEQSKEYELIAYSDTQMPDWTQNRVVFSDLDIQSAIEKFIPYTNKKLIVEGEALDSLHVNGVFALSDLDSFITSLDALYGIKSEYTDDSIIIKLKKGSKENSKGNIDE